MKHRAGLGGGEVVAYRSRLMDLLVKEILAENSTHRGTSATSGLSNMATVAIGGYGRGELAPFSDVDLMFLRKSRRAPEEASQIQTMLCLLWDMGFQVGHSVRTIKESLHMAQDDLTSLMSMLDARPLAGPGQLYIEFQERLRKGIDKDKKGLQEKILRSIQERHETHGGTAFIQEPNIKEAKGGLRDFHTIGWIAKAFYPGLTREQVLERHEVTLGEWKRAVQAYEFLQRLRNELHFLTNRRTDVLSHHLLASVVKNFNFRKGRFQKDSEAFLKHYYLQVRGIAQVADALLAPIEKALKPKTSWFSSRMTALSPLKPTSQALRQHCRVDGWGQSRTMDASVPVQSGRALTHRRVDEGGDSAARSAVSPFCLLGTADKLRFPCHPASQGQGGSRHPPDAWTRLPGARASGVWKADLSGATRPVSQIYNG